MHNYRKSIPPRILPVLIAAAFMAMPSTSPQAANHVNSSITNTHIVNLTANVDWDYDAAAPLQTGTPKDGNKAISISKDVLANQILREMARSVYLMTEGRHRIGTVYVYKNSRHGDNVDVRILNSDGRSSANPAAWQQATGTSNNYLSMEKSSEDLLAYSKVIAHELGHYLYGLYDEYREAGKASDPDPSAPIASDFPLNTMMHNHEVFTRLSVPSDYANAMRIVQTAQGRVFSTDKQAMRGGSAWEVLTRPVEENSSRTAFAAFQNWQAPTSISELSKYVGVYCPVDNNSSYCNDGSAEEQTVPAADRIRDKNEYLARVWEKSGGTRARDAQNGEQGTAFENFRVVFVDSPSANNAVAAIERNVIILDRTLPEATFKEAVNTAIRLVNNAEKNNQLAIVVSPADAGTTGLIVPMAPAAANKAFIINQLEALTATSGHFDMQSAYNAAKVAVSQSRQQADSSTINLLTLQDRTLPQNIGEEARGDRIRINPVGFRAAQETPNEMAPMRKLISFFSSNSQAKQTSLANGVPLSKIAADSGGATAFVKSSEDAIKKLEKFDDEADGIVEPYLSIDELPVQKSAGKNQTSFKVSKYDKKVRAEWQFDPADKNKLTFRLIPPGGNGSSTLDAESDLENGFASITLDSDGFPGEWRTEVINTAPTTDNIYVDVLADSELVLNGSSSGGMKSEKNSPKLEAKLGTTTPVINAKVTANIYNADTDAAVLSNVLLLDDGKGLDKLANDGVYTLDLSNKLQAGEYNVEIVAETTKTSLFQPNQRFSLGSTTLSTTLVGEGVMRSDYVELTLESGATGVLASDVQPGQGGSQGSGNSNNPDNTASTPSGGGGCSVASGNQADAGLLIMLIAAITSLIFRRNRKK